MPTSRRSNASPRRRPGFPSERRSTRPRNIRSENVLARCKLARSVGSPQSTSASGSPASWSALTAATSIDSGCSPVRPVSSRSTWASSSRTANPSWPVSKAASTASYSAFDSSTSAPACPPRENVMSSYCTVSSRRPASTAPETAARTRRVRDMRSCAARTPEAISLDRSCSVLCRGSTCWRMTARSAASRAICSYSLSSTDFPTPRNPVTRGLAGISGAALSSFGKRASCSSRPARNSGGVAAPGRYGFLPGTALTTIPSSRSTPTQHIPCWVCVAGDDPTRPGCTAWAPHARSMP